MRPHPNKVSVAFFVAAHGFGSKNRMSLNSPGLLAWITVNSFSSNTVTTGAFHASTRFRFGESSDNDRQQLHFFYDVGFSRFVDYNLAVSILGITSDWLRFRSIEILIGC